MTKIPQGAPGSCLEAELNAFRIAFPQGWPDVSLSPGSELLRPGDAMPMTIPPSAIGLTEMAASGRWPRLFDSAKKSGAPAAFWKNLILEEPAMAPFAFAGNVSRERLVERCNLIVSLHWIWGPALGCEEVATDYVVCVALDVLVFLTSEEYAKAPCRRASSRWRRANHGKEPPVPTRWSNLRACDLCWRFASGRGQTGFRIRPEASDLSCALGVLCDEHRPANGPLARSAWKRDKWLKPLITQGPQPGEPPWHRGFSVDDLLSAGLSTTGKWRWRLRRGFPRVVSKYPDVTLSLGHTLNILSGLDPDSVAHLLAAIEEERSRAGMYVLSMLISAEAVLWYQSRKAGRSALRRRRRRSAALKAAA